jgi:Transposase DNA-binding/Transposase Tn5 dimerisation domain/Transposase DDE domain
MLYLSVLSPRHWARETFGAAQLHDLRRTQRAVGLAAALLRRPQASLPEQLRSPAALKASYRLLGEEEVTCQRLLAPHCHQTRQAAGAHPVVLLVQDTTEVDYTHHPKTTGLGPIGDGRGRGYLLQSVLAVLPDTHQVLGLAHLEPFLRQPAPRQSSAQRKGRDRESLVWVRAVMAVGSPPPGGRWVHVGDRYSDFFEFFAACRSQQADFLVRAAQNRCVQDEAGEGDYLLSLARRLPAQAQRTLKVRAKAKQPKREAKLQLAYTRATLLAPQHPDRRPEFPPLPASLPVWVVRVWEVDAPAEVTEPLEWVLVTSVVTETVATAWERAEWYGLRWLCEDYHQCLKSGCSIEKRLLRDGEALMRLLGLVAPVAVSLLQLRQWARHDPRRLACSALPPELVAVVAALAGLSPEQLTVTQFFRAVAQQGGYLGRKSDGPPGWKTLWRGWLYVQAVLEGIHLAAKLPV